jgi:hypothetical protein
MRTPKAKGPLETAHESRMGRVAMSPAFLGGLVGTLMSFLAVRVMTTRWHHRAAAVWHEQTMILVQPPIRRLIAPAVVGFSAIGITIGLVRTAGPVYWPIVAFVVVLVGVGSAVVAVINHRRVAMCRTAIELRGIWGRRVAWLDVEKVEAFVLPKRSLVIFTGKDGKTIAVDSTLYGWEEFVEKAPELGRAAGKQLEEAVARVRGTP